MYELIRFYFEICLVKKAPQDGPNSVFVFGLALLLYTMVGFLLLYLSTGWLNSIAQLLFEIGFVLAFTRAMLYLSAKPGRFYQTASALLGTDALISFFALPVISVITTGKMQVFPFVVLMGLMVWHWFVTGHIFRHALSKPLSFGLGLAFLYLFSAYQVMAFLFPQVADI